MDNELTSKILPDILPNFVFGTGRHFANEGNQLHMSHSLSLFPMRMSCHPPSPGSFRRCGMMRLIHVERHDYIKVIDPANSHDGRDLFSTAPSRQVGTYSIEAAEVDW